MQALWDDVRGSPRKDMDIGRKARQGGLAFVERSLGIFNQYT